MARIRGDRSAGARGEEDQGAEEPEVRVRCPNPDCEIVYTVPARFAGKRARCAECGARTLIPSPRAAHPRAEAPSSVSSRTPAPTKRTQGVPAAAPGREVRIGCIGRGHAG